MLKLLATSAAENFGKKKEKKEQNYYRMHISCMFGEIRASNNYKWSLKGTCFKNVYIQQHHNLCFMGLIRSQYGICSSYNYHHGRSPRIYHQLPLTEIVSES